MGNVDNLYTIYKNHWHNRYKNRYRKTVAWDLFGESTQLFPLEKCSIG